MNLRPEFRSNTTRGRKFLKKIAKKFKKFLNNFLALFLAESWIRLAEKDRKEF